MTLRSAHPSLSEACDILTHPKQFLGSWIFSEVYQPELIGPVCGGVATH